MSDQKGNSSRFLSAELVLPQVARMMRPLVVMLIRAGVTFPALSNMLRELYVSVADSEFTLPDKPQTDSRISLLTGVHRKEISRLRTAEMPETEVSIALSRSSQIISRWTSLSEYCDAEGKPLPLPRQSGSPDEPSFESLVASVTRDVRPRAVLDDWINAGIVELQVPDLVVLKESALVPKAGDAEQLYYFGRNMHDHMAAAVSNVGGIDPPFLERAVHYDGLSEAASAKLAAEAKKAAMDILVEVNKSALQVVDAQDEGEWRWTAGVYVFREKMPAKKD